MTKDTPEVERQTVVDDVGLVYPTFPTASLSFAERHRTIGQIETVLTARVVKSDHVGGIPSVPIKDLEYGPTLLKRVVPEGRTSACRFENPGMSSAMARMLALAIETVKGFDSTSARLAASVYTASYDAIVKAGHPLDKIFKDGSGILLELTFDSGKSTNPNTGLESQFRVYATIGQLAAYVNDISRQVSYIDANSPVPEIKATVKAAKATKTVELDLAWVG